MHPKKPFCLEAVPPEKERKKDTHSLVSLHSNQSPEVQSRGTNTNPWILKNIIYYISMHTVAKDDRWSTLETEGLYLSLWKA